MGIGVGDKGQSGFPLPLTKPFVAAEEKRPVADNGSPDGRPELIALELGQTRIVRFALYVKKVSRIQIVIAVEFINVAMQFIAARFADSRNDSAGVPPILSAVCAGQHAKLPQHLDAEQVARGAARCVVRLIIDIGPIQEKAVGVDAATANAHLDAFALIGLAPAAEIGRHSRLQEGQLLEASPIKREIPDLFIIHQPG